MKTIMRYLTIVMISVLLVFSAYCEDAVDEVVIFVSEQGSDANDGITQAVATPARALEIAGEYIHASDVIVDIADGLYRVTEPIIINDDRTDGVGGHTLTLQGHGDTVIAGSVSLTGWQCDGGNVWSLELPECEEVYGLNVDGKPMAIASQVMYGSFYDADANGGIVKKYGERFSDFSHYGNVNEDTVELYYTSMRFKKAGADEMMNDLDNIRFRFDQTFMRSCWTIESITGGADTGVMTLKFTQETLDAINFMNMQDFDAAFDKCYLYGSKLFLDKEGEYCFDKHTHTLYLYSAEDPNTRNCEMPVSERLLVIEGTDKKLASGVNVRGIRFTGDADKYTMTHVYMERSADLYGILFTAGEGYERNTVKYYYSYGALYMTNASNITIEDCVFTATGMNAIDVYERVYNVRIEKCDFLELGGSAVTVGRGDLFTGFGYNDKYAQPEDLEHVYSVNVKKTAIMPGKLEINNCYISNTGLRTINASAIEIFFCSNTSITHNTVEGSAGCGIACGTGCSNLSISRTGVRYNGPFYVAFNRVSGSNRTAFDAGGIYTCGYLGEGSTVTGNFVDVSGSIKKNTPAIYLDEGTEYLTVTGNLCVNAEHWLSCRALPVTYSAGSCHAGDKPEKNTIMNCVIEGNYSEKTDKGQDYVPGYSWPYADKVNGSGVRIEDAYIDANWLEDPKIRSIFENAGSVR